MVYESTPVGAIESVRRMKQPYLQRHGLLQVQGALVNSASNSGVYKDAIGLPVEDRIQRQDDYVMIDA